MKKTILLSLVLFIALAVPAGAQSVNWIDDFIGVSSVNGGGVLTDGGTSGLSATLPNGVAVLTTGTNVASYVAITNYQPILDTAKGFTVQARIMLSSVSNVIYRMKFVQPGTNNSLVIQMSNASTTNWLFKIASQSNSSATNHFWRATTTVKALNATWMTLRVVWNPIDSYIRFYMNDTRVYNYRKWNAKVPRGMLCWVPVYLQSAGGLHGTDGLKAVSVDYVTIVQTR